MKKILLIVSALLILHQNAQAKVPGFNAAQLKRAQTYALKNINEYRQKNGKSPVTLNKTLSEIALIHSKDMALNLKKMSHDGSLGEAAHERIKQGKVPDLKTNILTQVSFPENIARSGENVGMRNIKNFKGSLEKAILSQHQYFMNEPNEGVTHRTTMLSKDIPFSEVGIGLWLDEKGNLWITEDYISH